MTRFEDIPCARSPLLFEDDLPSVVTRILGPAKSKARCSGAESQASSGKASVATHSIHVSGRTAGVTQVVPTKV